MKEIKYWWKRVNVDEKDEILMNESKYLWIKVSIDEWD